MARPRAALQRLLTDRFTHWRRSVVSAARSLRKDERELLDELMQAIDAKGLTAVAGDIRALLEKVAIDGGVIALDQVGIVDDEAMLSVVNQEGVDYAADRAAELIGMRYDANGDLIDNPRAEYAIDDATREMLREDVAQALAEGWSNDRLADVLEQNYAFSPERAETIARTETAFADVAGNLNGWRASGLVESKEWIVGAGCCDECLELDGVIVGLDAEFPGDGGDGPPLHPNCFLPGTLVSASGVTAQFERWFAGEVIVIRAPGMADLSVTPNHPVLTRCRPVYRTIVLWVNARLLYT